MILSISVRSLASRKSSVVLTLLSLMISVALLLSVEHIRLQAKESFNRTVSGTDLIVGARTGQLNLLLYSVFRIGNASNSVSYETVDKIRENQNVEWLIPIALGDSHRGYRVLGTTEDYFQHYKFGNKQNLEFASGRPFENAIEAVLGAEVAAKLNYDIGTELIVSHGVGSISFTHHDAVPFKVVGILKPTGTPVDKAVHVTLEGLELVHLDSGAEAVVEAIAAESAHEHHDDEHQNHDDHKDHDHGNGHDEHKSHDDHKDHDHGNGHEEHKSHDDHKDHDHGDGHDEHNSHDDHKDHAHGDEHDEHNSHDDHKDHDHGDGHDEHNSHDDHKDHDHGDEHDHSGHDHGDHEGHDHHLEPNAVTAVLLGLKSKIATFQVQQLLNKYEDEPLTAILPGVALAELWEMLGIVENILRVISILILFASLLGLSTMLLASMRERQHEIAVLRAIGAGAGTIFLLIQIEALLLATLGSLLAVGLVWLSLVVGKNYLSEHYGLFISTDIFNLNSLFIVLIVIGLTSLVALLPSIGAYRSALQTSLSQR